MTDRERLIKILEKYNSGLLGDKISDYLLAKGIIVLPCKVGDTVYYADYIIGIVEKCRVYGFRLLENNKLQLLLENGGCKFATEKWYYNVEQAERALKGTN